MPAETAPVDAAAADIAPVDASPAEAEPVDALPVETEPKPSLQPGEGRESPPAAEDAAYGSPEEKIIANYLASRNIKILFNGAIKLQHQRASTTLEMRVSIPETNLQWLEDRIILDHQGTLKGSVAKRALRRVLDYGERLRLAELAVPLFAELSNAEQEIADGNWLRLASIFKGDVDLTIAKIRQFFWLVKRKVSGERVERHMMLIVVSSKQGVGKTMFVDKLVSPWEEAATGPILITDVTDARSADIFRFPIGKVDDMEKVPVDKIAVLKSVLTSGRMRRRKLGTMGSIDLRQTLTLVGTANQSIHELVEDDTGHRRFAALEFDSVEGEESNERIWSIVNSIDYRLLWRSVDIRFGPPIGPYLNALAAEQRKGSLETDLLAWLQGIDIDSPEFLAIRIKGAIGASGLYELFVTQTGSTMSQTAFGLKMRSYSLRDDVPLGGRRKTSESNTYLIKPKNAAEPLT
ncbi:hypothetical protein X733_28460 [Mesorhizobium sp. L2C067A000]|nr:hypothetical protein X733_28460 [Mesorhizobium sp. L2C067A000]